MTKKVAIITGASSGLGEALARELCQQGWAVGMIARREHRLNQIAADIRQQGGVVEFIAADVADRVAVMDAVGQLKGRLGPVDLLLANAGISRPDYLEPLSIDDMQLMFNVNTLGVLYAIGAVLPDMIQRKAGHIAAVSSSGAYKGMPGSAAYCASKAAVSTLMEGLRIQLRDHNISATTICPGFVRTPMTDTNTFKMPWLQEPKQAAIGIVKAINRRKKVYNFPWQMAFVIKLFRCLPDWMVAKFVPRKSDTDPSAFDRDQDDR